MHCILLFAGPSKSGKTTLAKRLAESLAVPFSSFGDYVRKEAQRRGFTGSSSRELQELGSEMVEKDVKSFCEAVLEGGGYVVGHGLVIDGIRHMEAFATIQTLVPKQSVKLIYLESSLADRMKRSSLSARELREIDSHPVEADRTLLKSAADLVLSTSAESDECFETLLTWATQHCN
jgi:cytidylate kinase